MASKLPVVITAAALWPTPIDPEFGVDPGAEAGTMDETTVE